MGKESPVVLTKRILNGQPKISGALVLRLEVLPKEVVDAIRPVRGQFDGKQKAPTEKHISLRVDRDVVEAYRATGPGWQARANEALRSHVKQGGLQNGAKAGSARQLRPFQSGG